MNIFVCCKHVPDVEMSFRIVDAQLEEESLRYVMNAYDASALEWALQFRENGGSVNSISVVSIGEEMAKESLRKALAMGADEGWHILCESDLKLDSHGTAALLAKFFQKHGCDLLLCGKQAQDTDLGLSAGLLAAELNYPYISNVISLEISDNKAVAKRQGDDGVEVIKLPFPCVISCSNDINEPRIPTLKGLMASKRKPVNHVSLSDLDLSAKDLTYGQKTLSKILGISEPPVRKTGIKLEGDAAELVETLIDRLQNEARAL